VLLNFQVSGSSSRTEHPSQSLELRIQRHSVLCLFRIIAVKMPKLSKTSEHFYSPKYLATYPNPELENPPLLLYPNFVKIYLNIKLYSNNHTFYLKFFNRKSVCIPLPSHTCFFSLQSHRLWFE